MKCTIPEISWHNRDPVLSVDIQPKIAGSGKSDFNRLASGGTDSHVLIWHIKRDEESGSVSLDVAADLTRHQRAVNCVRWSPSGELLASGDDESVIMIWKQKGESEPLNILDATNESDKEIWITLKILRGHMEDVYDLNWSPNSLNLISGSVDNTAIVWDVQKGKSTAILNDHKGFVQGVTWDPLNQYLATLSTDRYFRVFDINTKKVVSRNSKCILPVPESSPLHGKTVKLFHDDTLQTFFRRLSFSPDGQVIVTPSGIVDIEGVAKPLNTTYIYTRYSFKQPAIVLPSPDQYTVAIRFCPVLYELNPSGDSSKKPVIPLPYRMVFAVATKSSVYLYDTQQKIPFGVISNIHYTRLTDLTWSNDGEILLVSSTDGFCSIIIFNENELGKPYKKVDDSEEPSKVDENPTKECEKVIKDEKLSGKPTKIDDVPKPISIRKAPRPAPIDDSKLKEVKMDVDDAPKPIAIRREPRPSPSSGTNETEKNKIDINDVPKPIAIRRVPRQPAEEPPKKITPEKIITIPPILRSDERFESPEQIDLPVTPIAVRRHPRPPNTPTSNTNTPTLVSPPTKFVQDERSAPTTPTSTGTQQRTEKSKKATPIAIRRKQRDPITPKPQSICEKLNIVDQKVEKDTVTEEAVDAWPIDVVVKNSQEKPKPTAVEQMNIDDTEDIRLVYTDDDEEEEVKTETIEPVTPIGKSKLNDMQHQNVVGSGGGGGGTTPKTPRRVDFKTISTPKSKKKLL